MAQTNPARAYAAESATTPLIPFSIERRTPASTDVQIEILYCGVCHSDLHQARNEWNGSLYPVVPGHEIVGRVTAVGSEVKQFKPGDLAAVGCMVDSCRVCPSCKRGLEQYCDKTPIWTYNSEDRHSGGHTLGGYSESIVVDQDFVLHVSEGVDLAGTAPLLCAGITTWSPLRHWNVGPGMKVGIVGLGGLGHMGLKFAHALGADVTLFTTSAGKAEDAKRLGADHVVVSRNEQEMKSQVNSFDFILDCVSAEHSIDSYLQLLKLDGTLVLVGVPEKPLAVTAFNVILPRKQFAGSGIGSIGETQEMLDYCAKNNITSDIELIKVDQINEAYERLLKSDVRYRFVIDMASLQN